MTQASKSSLQTDRLAVIGTAGHIDHGKTALVRRLTGIDTDRLPEEKARGISIDLGFANLTTPAGRKVGIVDVPGHERFVRNMLAGVTGIDLVLLVVAADEGVMPQTREHFAIVSLLGVPRGIVVLTKSDLVSDPDWLGLVERDVRDLTRGSFLEGAPIVRFSAPTGAGADALLVEIDRALEESENRPTQEPARLPIDRAFVVEGFGTVVTGTLWRGRVRVGDALEVLPRGHETRVRSVQVHGAQVEEARAGQRTAIALHHVEREDAARGQWLVAPGSLSRSQLLTVRLSLLAGAARPLKDRTRIRFHLGAAEILGRVALLESADLAPGASALAQISLEEPTVPARGDRFVVRSYSPSVTIGGGSVLEPNAERRRRGDVSRLAVAERGSEDERLLEAIRNAGKPLDGAALARSLGVTADRAEAGAKAEAEAGRLRALPDRRWVSLEAWEGARAAVKDALADFARRYPVRWGRAKGELKSQLGKSVDAGLFDAVLASLVEEGAIESRSDHLRVSGAAAWTPALHVAQDRVVEALARGGHSVPELSSLAVAGVPDASEHVQRLLFEGKAVRVSQDFVYTRAQWSEVENALRRHFASKDALRVADLKDLLGVSRKHAIPLLEYCDRVGLTLRVGDERKKGPRL
ncbi:MAG TPA: selenocysteine-specific translation elongation factor [Candidatus Eisenbacteria bacterium]|nr:selenocysteine-specific translation elongation factor [Candidatus Eisenbacteria bacterium]